eukprot:gene4036-4383_t
MTETIPSTSQGKCKVKILFDMETADIDDTLAMIMLAGHPDVHLLGVTVNPGGKTQIGFIQRLLAVLGRLDVLVGGGARGMKEDNPAWLGASSRKVLPQDVIQPYGPAKVVVPAHQVWAQCLKTHPDLTVVTGGPLDNFAAFLHHAVGLRWFRGISRAVCQGGFAGQGVVPCGQQLDKFAGRSSCSTYNLSNRKAAMAVLESDRVARLVFVSKNVCHGCLWGPDLEQALALHGACSPSVHALHGAMSRYKRREGKALHDVLAAAVAVREGICLLEEVCLRPVQVGKRWQWGSEPQKGSGVWISISYNRASFCGVVTACGGQCPGLPATWLGNGTIDAGSGVGTACSGVADADCNIASSKNSEGSRAGSGSDCAAARSAVFSVLALQIQLRLHPATARTRS